MKLSNDIRLFGHAALLFVLGAAVLAPTLAGADSLETSNVAAGFEVASIELGAPFGGAIGRHAKFPNILFVAVGEPGQHSILEVDTDAGTTRPMTGVIGNVGGMAHLNNSDMAISENMNLRTILRARGLAGGGLYYEVDEMMEFAPGQIGSAFSGSQMVVAPFGNAAGIPAYALLVQTSDGPGASEIMVFQNAASLPALFPAGGAWFQGFSYGGGLAFSPSGHVVCGVSDSTNGRVLGLVNADGNNVISAGEAHELVGADVLTNSLYDLAVSGDGVMVTVENSGHVRWFQLPDNLATGSVQNSGVLAQTNATRLSRVIIDSPDDFNPRGSGPTPTVYVGGIVNGAAATNLLAISPIREPANARGWEWLE